MLRYSFFLLSIWVAVAQSKPQYDPYYYSPYPYYPVGFRQSPVAYYPDGNRNFFGLLVTTSTSTTTCTVFTSSICSGRRKRFAIGDMEENDAIHPSAVHKVETTPVVEMGKRSDREADPQYAFYRSPQDYPLYGIEPTFGQNYFAYSSPEQLYNRPPINVADPRFGVYLSTKTTTTTVSSTPSCSTSSNFNRC